MQRGSFQWMKSLNKSIILNKIRTSEPISRAQIAKETKLTPPTVGTIVKELLEQQLILESKLGESQGGRKPTMLVLNTSGFHIIGIDVGLSHIQFVISDLSGKVIDETEEVLAEEVTKEDFLALLTNGVNRLKERHDSLQFIGIGVAMHGVVESESGVSIFAPNLRLRNIPIKSHLEEVFRMDVKVENDAKAFALGEAWFQGQINHRSMVAVNIGRGIGAGIVIDGKLYNGEHGIAGEIGHMTIDINGKKCSCGNHGCLQTLASGPAIAERAKELLEKGGESIIAEWINEQELSAELVHKAALQNDQLAIKILHDTGVYIGIALTNLVHVWDPSIIIIGGGVSKAGDYIMTSIKETLVERTITEKAKTTLITISQLGSYGSSLGSVALILSELFEPTLL
ncbi:ROK family protein (putative glucokinase) [Gracilibacillus ureilyticus]|uniref:ROK family protein (Putative glucokinase) n=1 Tax=Gracilibacillus ureilyticus TaxID=531814 RepID=A0A1H9T2R3_9BACI|nr:ROK family transcriptional regulator [Gracilibacillus ureilyticus]SER91019.1 ROK family protein (putative glucokinase) [Gracilibacillus ureilyticus]